MSSAPEATLWQTAKKKKVKQAKVPTHTWHLVHTLGRSGCAVSPPLRCATSCRLSRRLGQVLIEPGSEELRPLPAELGADERQGSKRGRAAPRGLGGAARQPRIRVLGKRSGDIAAQRLEGGAGPKSEAEVGQRDPKPETKICEPREAPAAAIAAVRDCVLSRSGEDRMMRSA